MKPSRQHPISTTIRLLILAMLIVPLSVGTALPARAFASPAPVDLGLAGSFAVLSKAGITNVPTSAITGNLGTSPINAASITGFALTLDSTNTFSTSTQVTGKVYAADYAAPTPILLGTAVSNMETAYTDAAGRSNPDATELYSGILDSQTLAPGLYKWGTGVSVGITTDDTDVTLSGSATDVWIFQIAGDLTIGSDSQVLMAGGALPENVFWQVAGGTGVEIGTGAHVEGNILAIAAIHLRTGATLNGRALAQTAVTLEGNTVVSPGPAMDLRLPETIGIYDAGTFYLRDTNTSGPSNHTFGFGWVGPVPLVGDWDGDGVATVGLLAADGWFFLRNSNSSGDADLIFQFGWDGATPLMGDWDGNGTDTVGLYSDGWFFLRNSNSSGPADMVFQFGGAGPIPLAGDWDGNGTDTVGLFDNGTFFLRNSNTPGPADLMFGFGWAGATPLVGDWDGDGVTTPGIVSAGTFFLRNSNSSGPADLTFGYGWAGATPLAGLWDLIP